MCLLTPLVTSDKLNEMQMNTISKFFASFLSSFEHVNLATIDDDEIFLFINCVSTLANITKKDKSFYGRLSNVLKFDFLPMLVAKAHLSRKEEIMMTLFELASVDGFPNKKVAFFLSKAGTKAEKAGSQMLYDSFRRREVQSGSFKLFNRKLNDDLQKTIETVNSKFDCNDIAGCKTSQIVHLYKHKVSLLNNHLSSLTESLDRSTKETAELKQTISSFKNVTEKQEFTNWCLLLDNERMVSETQNLKIHNESLQMSLNQFKLKMVKEDAAKKEAKAELKQKIKEIERKSLHNFSVELKFLTLLSFQISNMQRCKPKQNFKRQRRSSNSHKRKMLVYFNLFFLHFVNFISF